MGSVPTTASWGILQIWDEQEAEPRDVALVGDRKFVIGCIDEAHHATHLASPSRVNCDHRPSPQADVKIPARCVSSAHCTLWADGIEPGTDLPCGVRLRDTSTNGTFVNGKAIGKNAECALRVGDKITFSKAREGGVGLYNIDHTPVTLAHSLALPAWVHDYPLARLTGRCMASARAPEKEPGVRATKRGRASDEAGQSMHAVAFLVNEVRPDNASNSRPPKAQQNRSNAPPGEPERAAAAAGDAGGLRAGTAELVATRAAADAGHETIDVEQEKGTRREAAAESGATWWLIAGEAELVATPAAEEVRHETIAVVQQDSIRPVSALATAAWTVVDIADAEAAARARDGACGNAQRLIAALRSAQAEAAHAVAGAAVAAEELRTAVRDSVVARIELEVTRRSLAEAEGEEKTLRILLVSEREDAANVKAELQAIGALADDTAATLATLLNSSITAGCASLQREAADAGAAIERVKTLAIMKALCGSSTALAMQLRIALDPLVGTHIDDAHAVESLTSMDHVADASAMVSPRLDKRPIADAATTDAASEAITSHPDEGVNASEGNTAVGSREPTRAPPTRQWPRSQHLVLMLRGDPRRETTSSACMALWRLSTSNDDNKVTIAREGAIPYLVEILSSENHHNAGDAAMVLGELSNNDDIRVDVVRAGVIPPLVAMLSSRSYNVNIKAMNALRNLLSDNNNKEAIARAGAIPHLVEILRKDHQNARDAAMVLGELSTNDSIRAVAVRAGAIPVLAERVKRIYGDEDVREAAAEALRILTGYSS